MNMCRALTHGTSIVKRRLCHAENLLSGMAVVLMVVSSAVLICPALVLLT